MSRGAIACQESAAASEVSPGDLRRSQLGDPRRLPGALADSSHPGDLFRLPGALADRSQPGDLVRPLGVQADDSSRPRDPLHSLSVVAAEPAADLNSLSFDASVFETAFAEAPDVSPRSDIEGDEETDLRASDPWVIQAIVFELDVRHQTSSNVSVVFYFCLLCLCIFLYFCRWGLLGGGGRSPTTGDKKSYIDIYRVGIFVSTRWGSSLGGFLGGDRKSRQKRQ